MNLKSKAISEIRATILTLSPHPEFADRIEGLQVLLGELEGEQGGMGVPTEQIEAKFSELSDKYDYDHNECPIQTMTEEPAVELVKWAISQMQPEWVSVTERLPEVEADYYVSVNGKVDIQTYCGSDRWTRSYNHYPKTSELSGITDWMPTPELPQPPTK